MTKVVCTKETLSKQKQLLGFTVSDQVQIYGSNVHTSIKHANKTNRHHVLLNLINEKPELVYDGILPTNLKVDNSNIVSFYNEHEKFLFGKNNEKLTKANYMVCLGNKETSVSNFFHPKRQEVRATTVQSSIFIALKFEIEKCKNRKKCIKKVFLYFYNLGYVKAVAI